MSEKENRGEIARKQSYLEALRIVALFFVMYNHSSMYMALESKSGFEYSISFFFSMICKSAVPLFFMISGVLLLGKNESFSDIFKKRIFRYIIVIIIFSFLCYIKTVMREQIPFSLSYFGETIVREPIYLPYWFLYSYVAFLIMLPVLRPLAQNMSEKTYWYLILLQVIWGSLKTMISFYGGVSISNFFELGGLFQSNIFYPLIGYGLVRYAKKENVFLNKNNIFRNFLIIPAAVITEQMMRLEYLDGKRYQETYLAIWIPVISVILFWDIKILFREENLSEKTKKILSYAGGCVFGCYLLSGLVGTGGRLSFFYQITTSVVGELPACILRIICDFFVQLCIVIILKKVPGIRRLL